MVIDDNVIGMMVGGAIVAGSLGAIVLVAKLIAKGLRSPTEGGRRLRTVANVVLVLMGIAFSVSVIGWVGTLALAVAIALYNWILIGFKKPAE